METTGIVRVTNGHMWSWFQTMQVGYAPGIGARQQ